MGLPVRVVREYVASKGYEMQAVGNIEPCGSMLTFPVYALRDYEDRTEYVSWTGIYCPTRGMSLARGKYFTDWDDDDDWVVGFAR